VSGDQMDEILRQAQEMQRKLMAAQEEVAALEVEGSAGGGAVRVVVSGPGDVQSVTIAPEAIDPDDVAMLEDLVQAAVNDAFRRRRELEAERFGGLAGGLGLPPGLV
jgi:nucleoid-associated protein EbfC